MIDTLSKEERSERMAKIRSRDTKPELQVRKIIHGMGYRYRLHRRDLPGTPDIVFPSRKKVVFIHGCFWHRHTNCKIGHIPKTKQEFWIHKLEENAKRDQINIKKLKSLGWESLVIWECQIKHTDQIIEKIRQFLG